MKTFLLKPNNLDTLIQILIQEGYQVLGPTIRDQVIVHEEIRSIKDLPQGWGDEQEKGMYRIKNRNDQAYFGYAVSPTSWKRFLQLPKRKVWDAILGEKGIEFKEHVDETRPMAFLGLRSCELHAIGIQDRVFIQNDHQNSSYKNRREKLFIVAVNCTTSAATCFCTSMNTGPKVTLPCDIEMTEVINEKEHYFLVRSGTAQGEAILKKLPLNPALNENIEKENFVIENNIKIMERNPRKMDSSDVKDLLYRNMESKQWDEVANRCLSCANCTLACPTCFCSTVEDVTDLKGDHAQRWERWDSCFTVDHSYIHGGAVRQSTRSRYRQWMTHKLATWFDQFGTSGCVGCGLCITWCPVGIDLTEEVKGIRDKEKAQK